MEDKMLSDKSVDHYKELAFFEFLANIWSIYPITVIGNIVLCITTVHFLIPGITCKDMYGICVFFIIGSWIGMLLIPALMLLLSFILIPIDKTCQRAFSKELSVIQEQLEKDLTLDFDELPASPIAVDLPIDPIATKKKFPITKWLTLIVSTLIGLAVIIFVFSYYSFSKAGNFSSILALILIGSVIATVLLILLVVVLILGPFLDKIIQQTKEKSDT